MLQWICRHHNHKLFMVIQDLHPEQPDPHMGNSPIGTDTSRNLKQEVRHGKAQAALSAINLHE